MSKCYVFVHCQCNYEGLAKRLQQFAKAGRHSGPWISRIKFNTAFVPNGSFANFNSTRNKYQYELGTIN